MYAARSEEEVSHCVELWEALGSAGLKGLGIPARPGEKSIGLAPPVLELRPPV